MEIDPHDQWGRVEIDETLLGRRAGGSAAEKARELKHEAPLRTLAGRLFRQHTEERAWRKGANGERMAAFWLRRLPSDRWHVFQDVPVGERGTNIDHVVVGPAGVFTVNTKNLTGTVTIYSRAILQNGHKTDFLRNSSHEAERASRLLSSALDREVPVTAVLAIIADDWKSMQKPSDIHVGSPREVRNWLSGLPELLTPYDVRDLCAVAAKPATWNATPAGSQLPAGHVDETILCSCGGTIVRRVRKKDGLPFLGCSRFPSCRKTWPSN